jgi:hypothetical protein
LDCYHGQTPVVIERIVLDLGAAAIFFDFGML